MAAPPLAHIVKGEVRDRLGNLLVGSTVTLTHATIKPVLTATVASDGKYMLNLGDLDSPWTVGQNITLFSETQFEGRKSTTVAISSGGEAQTVNLTMEETSDFKIAATDELNQHNLNFVTLTTYDQEKVTHINPLPVNSSEIDLMYNPITDWTITRSDGQPDSETVTLANGDIHKRTYSYDSNDFLIQRSKWEKQ